MRMARPYLGFPVWSRPPYLYRQVSFPMIHATRDFAQPHYDEKPKVHAEGRRCANCPTLLNRFNPGPTCHICTRKRRPPSWRRGDS